MTIEQVIKKGLTRTFERMFDLDKFKFDRIFIKQNVIEDVTELAKSNHPREFLAFLDGEISDKKLTITGLLYQEYNANENSAAPIFRFPTNTFYGSVHSHPGNSNRPSSADKQFFRKVGIVNMIICKPYTADYIKFYNHDGEEINISIE